MNVTREGAQIPMRAANAPSLVPKAVALFFFCGRHPSAVTLICDWDHRMHPPETVEMTSTVSDPSKDCPAHT